jgi:hypothetical protein
VPLAATDKTTRRRHATNFNLTNTIVIGPSLLQVCWPNRHARYPAANVTPHTMTDM